MNKKNFEKVPPPENFKDSQIKKLKKRIIGAEARLKIHKKNPNPTERTKELIENNKKILEESRKKIALLEDEFVEKRPYCENCESYHWPEDGHDYPPKKRIKHG